MSLKKIVSKNTRAYLIFAIMAIIAFFPTGILSAASNGIVGTWSVSGINNYGTFMMTKIVLSADNSGSLVVTDQNGNVLKARSFVWSINGDALCMRNNDGSGGCVNIDYVTYANMSLSSQAGTTVYTRSDGQIPFTGRGPCCKSDCTCTGWESGTNGKCKHCPHSMVMHRSPSGCTYH